MDLEDYKSVQNWLTKPDGERRYKPSGERDSLRRLRRWCNLFGKTPDQIVDANPEEVWEMEIQLATPLIKRGLKKNGIKKRLSHFYMFLHYNGVDLTKEIKDWEITPHGEMKWIFRLKKYKNNSATET